MDYSKEIIEIFDHFDIEWWDKGKNVTDGWINIQCPFCDDASNHCGTDIDSLQFSCWKCRESGNFSWLIHVITGVSTDYVEELLDTGAVNFRTDVADQINDIGKTKNQEETASRKIKIQFPKEAERITINTDSDLFLHFIERRRLTIKTCIEYGCYICEYGEYKMRMIIPVYFENKLVAWQAMDMTGMAELKYRTSPGAFINDYLSSYDVIKPGGRMILTEGRMDEWRVGENTVCTFGTSLTTRQKRLIYDKKPKELIFAWDGEAYQYAKEMGQEMAPYIGNIKVLELPWGIDPDDYGQEETLALIEDTRSL